MPTGLYDPGLMLPAAPPEPQRRGPAGAVRDGMPMADPESFPSLSYESIRVARRFVRHPAETLATRRALARWFRSPLQVLRFRAYRGEPAPAALTLRDGRTLHLRAGTDDKAILEELLVDDLYRLDEFLAPGLGCVVDVGAHAGIFALLVAPYAERLLCLEPAPDNRALLERNLSADGTRRASVRPWAVGAGDGRLTLLVDPLHNSCHSAYEELAVPSRARTGLVRLDVPSRSLESLLETERIGRIALLKLDCEGGEHEFLGSAPDAALARVDEIRCECHTLRAPQRADATTLGSRLERAGFRVTLGRTPSGLESASMLFARQQARVPGQPRPFGEQAPAPGAEAADA